MTTKLLLDADYHCLPVWELESERTDSNDCYFDWDVTDDLAKLPIDVQTIQDLERWAEAYDSSFLDSSGNEDFTQPSLWTREQWQSFWQQGASLWIRMRKELGSEYEVFYRMYITPEKHYRLLKSPDELSALDMKSAAGWVER